MVEFLDEINWLMFVGNQCKNDKISAKDILGHAPSGPDVWSIDRKNS